MYAVPFHFPTVLFVLCGLLSCMANTGVSQCTGTVRFDSAVTLWYQIQDLSKHH